MIIEDNHDGRDSLAMLLDLLGHRVNVAEDGLKGLDAILNLRPEIALIDIGLPGMDGYELARRARATLGGSVVLIALTGYGTIGRSSASNQGRSTRSCSSQSTWPPCSNFWPNLFHRRCSCMAGMPTLKALVESETGRDRSRPALETSPAA